MAYPLGRGFVHITSGNDVTAPPDFDSGLYSRCDLLTSGAWCTAYTENAGKKIS